MNCHSDSMFNVYSNFVNVVISFSQLPNNKLFTQANNTVTFSPTYIQDLHYEQSIIRSYESKSTPLNIDKSSTLYLLASEINNSV